MKPVISPVISPVCAPVLRGQYVPRSGESAGAALLVDLAEWFELDEVSGNRTGAHAGIVLTQSGTVGSGTGVAGVGTAAEFDGVNDKLQCNDNATLSLGADTPLTIAFWMRPNAPGDTWIISKDGGTGFDVIEYKVKMSSGLTMGGAIGNGVTGDDGNFSNTANNAAWNFVVWQHDPTANVQQLALDNGAFTTRAWSGGTYNGANPFTIGAYSGGSQWFKGRLARIGVWKRVLPAEELTYLYNDGNGRSYSEF